MQVPALLVFFAAVAAANSDVLDARSNGSCKSGYLYCGNTLHNGLSKFFTEFTNHSSNKT
jgi:hypothetical protein